MAASNENYPYVAAPESKGTGRNSGTGGLTRALYEMVREIPNLCRNNHMRDVFFDEVQTDDPEDYVRRFLKQEAQISADIMADGSTVVYAVIEGVAQKFTFTPV